LRQTRADHHQIKTRRVLLAGIGEFQLPELLAFILMVPHCGVCLGCLPARLHNVYRLQPSSPSITMVTLSMMLLKSETGSADRNIHIHVGAVAVALCGGVDEPKDEKTETDDNSELMAIPSHQYPAFRVRSADASAALGAPSERCSVREIVAH
jgi:hypothetical protein